ncbi:MAG: GerMN domain-containing protein [Pedobacter sp.]
MKKSSSRYLIPISILILLAAGLFTYRILQRQPQVEQDTSGTAEVLPQREVLLYFASQDGFSLITEAREVPEAEEEQLVMEIIQALAAGSHASLSPILPPGVRLLGYSQQEGIATLDFSKELVAAHPGGSMSELLTVYGLVNTLAVNFPHIRKVRILVEEQPVETLKGHVDLRQPIAADFRFARPSTEDEASTLQENP